MSSILKLACTVALLVFALTLVPAASANTNVCHAIKAAEAAPCVASQLGALRASTLFQEDRVVEDMDATTKCVEFIFVPKCLNGPIPCRIATQTVTAIIDCTTETATCP